MNKTSQIRDSVMEPQRGQTSFQPSVASSAAILCKRTAAESEELKEQEAEKRDIDKVVTHSIYHISYIIYTPYIIDINSKLVSKQVNKKLHCICISQSLEFHPQLNQSLWCMYVYIYIIYNMIQLQQYGVPSSNECSYFLCFGACFGKTSSTTFSLQVLPAKLVERLLKRPGIWQTQPWKVRLQGNR